MRAARVLLLLLVGAVIGAAAPSHALSDEMERQIAVLGRTVDRDPSEKARIAATVALGRLADPRTLVHLVVALDDASPIVRGLAASALGHLGNDAAAPALERVRHDRDEGVRARVRDALARLRPAPAPPPPPPPPPPVPTKVHVTPREAPRRPTLHVVVKPMAVKASAGKHLGARMRDLVVQRLTGEPGLTVDEDAGELVVDGTITRLSHEARGQWIETTCEVKLTVSSGAGNLLSMVSGGATVQTARRSWNKTIEPSLQTEALDSAMRGLEANLLTLLQRQSVR